MSVVRQNFRRLEWQPLLLGLLGVVLSLVAWELMPRIGLVPSQDIPPFSQAVSQLVDLVGTSSFWSVVRDTVIGWALALVVAIAVGVPLGLLIGSQELAWRALRPTIEFLRPVPAVALIPLAILAMGAGLGSKVFLAAFGALWPLLIQTIYGVRELDQVARDTGRVFGFTRTQQIFRILVPSALPFIATGLRISSATALIISVTAELVIGAPGLGKSIEVAQSGGATELMYALILATGLLGLLIHLLFSRLERLFLAWHPSQLREGGP